MSHRMRFAWYVRTVRGSEYRVVIKFEVLSAETLKALEAAVLSFDHTEEGKIVSATCEGWCLVSCEKEKDID